MSDLDKLLSFDPMATAESLTGSSYKDDHDTIGVGILLAAEHAKAKERALTAADDTNFNVTFLESLRIHADLGFIKIHEHDFPSSSDYTPGRDKDTYVVLWQPDDGILATVESYGNRVNSSSVYYNIVFNEGVNHWGIVSSGGMYDGVWIGDHNTCDALRHKLNRLRANGAFQPRWFGRPTFFLLDYQQWRQAPEDYSERSPWMKRITAEVIASFPTEVQNAITPDREDNR